MIRRLALHRYSGIALLLVILVSLLVPMSCEHREFVYDLPSKRVPVTVEFDWSRDPGAAPKGMTVYFFRVGSKSNSAATYDFLGRDGGSITLSPGIYGAICHNNDSDRHGFVGTESFDEFGIRMNDHRGAGDINNTPGVHPHNEDERIAHTPDSMWVASIQMFEIMARDPGDTSPARPQIIRFDMHPVVNHYTFHIHNPLNFNKSISVSATISGLAGTVHPGRGVNGEETVSHLFSMSPTAGGGLFGEILTFGHCGGDSIWSRDGEDSSVPHVLVVRAILSNGTVWNSVHDVTEQIHGSESPDCVVELDSVAFPKSTATEGWAPSVGGWTGSQESIGM